MRTYRYRSYLAAAVAGAGIFLSVLHTVFVLAWICMIPLFVCLEGASRRKVACMGAVTGAIISLCGFSWMIPGAETFTGSSAWYGVGVFLICTLVFSAYWALLVYVFAWLRPGGRPRPAVTAGQPGGARLAALRTALLAGSLWVCAEAGLQYLAQGMPWFLFHTGNALAANLFAVQPLSWVGIHGATFAIVAVNYGFARCIARKEWRRLVWPVGAVLLYMAWGWALFNPSETAYNGGPSFKLSILSENIPPAVQWDSASGNALVARLLSLDQQAAAGRPDMTLWSESAIPWTYKPDDDLVREMLRITAPARITHILGMNTAYSDRTVYNSAYCLLPNGSVSGRYDKRILLMGIEKPLNGWLIPFFSSNGYAVHAGVAPLPLATPFGPAGILICNESAVPAAAADAVRNGARFLLNLSNDGWFNDTYLVPLHFYNARLRAIETRKDIAVNSNNGISGLIRASGEIETSRQSDESFVTTVSVRPNNYITPAVRFPLLPVCICGLYLLYCAGLSFFRSSIASIL